VVTITVPTKSNSTIDTGAQRARSALLLVMLRPEQTSRVIDVTTGAAGLGCQTWSASSAPRPVGCPFGNGLGLAAG
jgi:hypothetical protein